MMILLPAIIPVTLSGLFLFWYYKRGALDRFLIFKCVLFGFGIFVSAFLIQVALLKVGVDSLILNVVLEESLKVAAIYRVRKLGALPIVLTFAATEVLSKYSFLFVFANEYQRTTFEIHLLFFSYAILSAYIMHAVTAIMYYHHLSWAMLFSMSYHLTYNILATGVESNPSNSNGLFLLLSTMLMSALFFGAFLLVKCGWRRYRRPGSSTSGEINGGLGVRRSS